MQYREIVAVTGLGGLFQLVASKADGAIVRSLEDKTTRFISSRMHNFTPLESIEVFTTGENVNLADIFKAMEEKMATFPPIAGKADNATIKNYFKSIYPELDEEKVYVSDMKKMVKWFEILKINDLLKFEEILAEENEASASAKKINDTAEENKESAVAAPEKPKKPRAKKTSVEEDEAEKVTAKTKAKKETASVAAAEEELKKTAKPRKKKTTE